MLKRVPRAAWRRDWGQVTRRFYKPSAVRGAD